MTNAAWLLLAGAGACAVLDWTAVVAHSKQLEYLAKPATLVLLIGAALALDPHHEAQRWAFVVALIFSLAGDVLLMIDRFLPGLVAFFFGHLAYIAGLRMGRSDFTPLAVSALIVFTAAAVVGRPILKAVRENAPDMATPVAAYVAVISVMVACALASGNAFAATAAVLFMASDSLVAWNRFVKPLEWGPITIIVTYHLAQAGFVLALAK